MKYKVQTSYQGVAVNTMTGDISYDELKKVEGISTIALKLSLKQSKNKSSSFFKKNSKQCPLAKVPLSDICYKNMSVVCAYLSKRGQINQSRITSISKKKQRYLKNAIKVARNLGLIPYVNYGYNDV